MDTTTKTAFIEEVIKAKAKQERRMRYIFAAIGTLLSFFITITADAQQTGDKYSNNVDAAGVILDGYDAVGFFTDYKPVKGNDQFRFAYAGAIYNFASQEHRDLFKAKPEMYKPQFGGWCAYTLSLGRIAPIDVNTFSIVDGKLFIQHNQRAVNGWNKDVPRNIVLADKYWPAVAANNGKQIKTDAENAFYNNTTNEGIIMEG